MLLKRITPDSIFGEADTSNLSTRSVKGGIYSTLAQAFKFFLGLGSTMILARLLTPDDFGLIAMVAVFINFAAMFKDAGLSMATIQRKRITQEEISGLFWTNVILSLGLAVLMILIIPLVVSFYERDEISEIMIVAAISFFISGLSVQHKALMQRLLQFKLLGFIDVISQLFALLIAVFLAYVGFEYMSLVYKTLFLNLITVVLMIFYLPWKPDLSFEFKKIKEMLLFGTDITGFNLVNYFSRNGDNIIIGKFLGSEQLGIYTKAYQIFMMPIFQIRNPITNVTTPVLSKLQNEPDRFKNYCSIIVEILAILSFPITIVCYLEATFIINLFLGEGWEDAIPIFKVLSLLGPLQVILGIRGSILISLGYTKRFLILGVVYAVITIATFLIGIQFGINGLVWAYVAGQYFLFVPSLFYTFYKTPFTVTAFFKSVMPQFILSIVLITIHYFLIENIEWKTYISIISIILIPLIFGIVNLLRTDFKVQALKIFDRIKRK